MDSAYRYLLLNRDQSIPAILAYKRGAQVVLCQEGGVILYEKAINLYYISLDDNSLLEADWYNAASKAECLVLRENNIEAVKQRIHPTIVNPCRQMLFLGNAPACPKSDGLEIKKLSMVDLEFVCAHYKMHLDDGYIAQRISAGYVYGAYYNGALAGFAGRHSDGSMGMLEVLPQYQRLGIGSALGCFMINLVLDSGEIPYAHIFPDNEASLGMTSRIPGAVFTDELVAWMA